MIRTLMCNLPYEACCVDQIDGNTVVITHKLYVCHETWEHILPERWLTVVCLATQQLHTPRTKNKLLELLTPHGTA
jgi:hypothetical protein